MGSPRFMWITTDYSAASKELVQKYKFGQQRAAASSIADLMMETFLSFNSDEQIARMNYLIVPIPTASSRVRQRGFDHAALLSEKIADKLNLQSGNALERRGQTRQVGAKRSERLAQAKGNYYVRKPKLVLKRNILLIDDVVTTGATLAATSRLLRKAGARRVDALVFAKRR
jgi:ComF family protein